MKKTLPLISLALLGALTAPLSHAAYIFQTLPVLDDYYVPQVKQINENSTIVGTLYGYGVVGACWSSSGSLSTIASVGPAHSAWTNGINNAGLIVGMLDKDGGYLRPFYSAPLLGPAILPTTAPAGATVELKVINDNGYAVGTHAGGAVYTHPLGFKGSISSAKVGSSFQPVAINNAGDVAGNSSLKGVVYNLHTAQAVTVSTRVPTVAKVAAMNELGDVAGTRTGNTAFIMPKLAGTPVIYLGSGKVKTVHGMNDARELLVTTTANRPAILRPSRMMPDGELEYLDTAIPAPWKVHALADINNAGTICGVVTRPSTPSDDTSDSQVHLPFKMWEFLIFFPVFP